MKSLFLKIMLAGLVGMALLAPVVYQLDSGHFDPFYTRFTTGRAPSLIIGTSRAAQGLQPAVFSDLAPGMQNFAFTLSHSPYGAAYLELIKKKVDPEAKEGLFILSVDPWSLSSFSAEEDEEKNFRENKLFTANIKLVNTNPNLEYMLRFAEEPLYTVFTQKREHMKLHKDGWLQVNTSIDSASVRSRTRGLVRNYQSYAQNAFVHPLRVKALEETIQFLQAQGRVVLVRIPASKEIAAIETAYAPLFNEQIQELANRHGVQFFDYLGESGQYVTTDGLHLYKDAGRLFSEELKRDISRLEEGRGYATPTGLTHK
jgi:hypothetical protein